MTVTGIVWITAGLIVLVGQSVSVVNFRLAQKLGLQEKTTETDPLFRSLELNAARWDVLVFWTLPAAGILLLVGHPWWPFLALIAGGVCVDMAGREVAKTLGLSKHGVRTGSRRETSLYMGFMGITFIVGLWCVALGMVELL